jgi:hypothetical protein
LMINNILQLTPTGSFPSPAVEGMIVAQGAPGSSKPYYYDGTIWNALF